MVELAPTPSPKLGSNFERMSHRGSDGLVHHAECSQMSKNEYLGSK